MLIWIGLWVFAFIDSITTDPVLIRVMPKAGWIVLILLFSGFAAIAWFVFGRPRRSTRAGVNRTTTRSLNWQANQAASRTVTRRPAVAPDDNPEFLQQLRRDISRDRTHRDQDPDNGPGPASA